MANEMSETEYYDWLRLYYYGVKPQWALAVVATFLFTCATLVHLVLLYFQRAWFLIPLIIGCLFEVIGYAFRAAGLHEKVPNASTFVTSSTLIIIAPAFIAASLYQLLAHIIAANGRGGPKLMTKLGLGFGFGALDVLAYALQAAGSTHLRSGPFVHSIFTTLKQTRTLLLAGNLLTLLLTLTPFTALTAYYTLVLRRGGTSIASTTPFRLLLLSLALLFIRTLYRIVAYSKGLADEWGTDASVYPLKTRPLFREGWGYGFDALVIFVLVGCVAAWYPTQERLGEDEVGGGAGAGAGLTGGVGGRSCGGRKRGGVLRGSSVRMEGFARA